MLKKIKRKTFVQEFYIYFYRYFVYDFVFFVFSFFQIFIALKKNL